MTYLFSEGLRKVLLIGHIPGIPACGDNGVVHQLAGHTGNRILTGRIYVGNDDPVCKGKRRSELPGEISGTGKQMRLEAGDDPPLPRHDTTCRAKGGAQFGRVMGVIVKD